MRRPSPQHPVVAAKEGRMMKTGLDQGVSRKRAHDYSFWRKHDIKIEGARDSSQREEMAQQV